MKKLKHKILSYFKRPKYIKVNSNEAEKLCVLRINDNTDSLIDALGITESRAEYLIIQMDELFNTEEDIADVAEKVSKICVHANELFFISMCIYKRQNYNPANYLQKV